MVAVTYFLSSRVRKTRMEQVKHPNNFWKTCEALAKGKQVFNDTAFPVYKGPLVLKYVRMNQDFVDVVEDLGWLLKYQPDPLVDMLIYAEYFFKFHYNVVIGKYDACTYIPIMKDLQRLILNTLSIGVFSLPTISTIVDIKDIDGFMFDKRKDIHAILTKYMTILRHKFKCAELFEGPVFDVASNNHDLYV